MKKIKPAKSDLFSVGEANKRVLSLILYALIFLIVIAISKSALDSNLKSEQDIVVENVPGVQVNNNGGDYERITGPDNNPAGLNDQYTERLRLAVELKREAESLPESEEKTQFFFLLNSTIDDGVVTKSELEMLSRALRNAKNL